MNLTYRKLGFIRQLEENHNLHKKFDHPRGFPTSVKIVGKIISVHFSSGLHK